MTENRTDHPAVAYFCMEFGLHQDFPIYAGGLGVLAGDLLKAAGDQGRPLVGIGIFWNKGYTVQTLDEGGNPVDAFVPTPRDVLEPTGVEVTVNIRGKDMAITAHRVTAFGNAPLYLLEPVDLEDRWVAQWLYGGDDDDRVAQEVLLGVGGVRVLQALGIPVDLHHFNEGHALFAGLELIRQKMAEGLSFEDARLAVRDSVVFTTHTPVPAGNEVHPVDRLLAQGADVGVLTREQLVSLGGDPFEMTPAALRLCRSANAVANLHGETARIMWERVPEAATIHSVTNGVHMPTWQDRDLSALRSGPSAALWDRHMSLKRSLLDGIEALNGVRLDEDVLLIGFARRAATYKRANLVLRDLNWLEPLIRANKIQIVFSGKAHPRDEGGKDLVREIARMSREYPKHIVFLQNYGMELGALLTRGCDVWLNTPRRPQEASGTSGMKAAANGILNVSILDGWWAEGCEHGVNGWQFGDGYEGEGADAHDERALHQVMDTHVLPTFYEDRDRWLTMMASAIETAEAKFSAAGMLARYDEVLYGEI
ncbi:MAG: alpha-glucan family phosphorylase [Proteobacteria bacterium]|nr:alpha-glucan family phosphorylase [Pseudomonadota bacterium]